MHNQRSQTDAELHGFACIHHRAYFAFVHRCAAQRG
jgi:hypothetical protein